MEKTQQFLLSNIQTAENFQITNQLLYWQGKSFCPYISNTDYKLDGENFWASFGSQVIITKDAHLQPMQIATLSPFLTAQGVTTALIMLDHLPSSQQLAIYARQLKDKTSVHIGWLLPLSEDLSLADIKQLETAPAVCGWYCDNQFINIGKFTNIASITKPIIIHAPLAPINNFHILQQMLTAMGKQGFITALNDDAQSVMPWLGLDSKASNQHLPCIVTDQPHLIQNFWQSWQKQYQQKLDVYSLSLMNEYIAQSYQLLGIKNKGRLHAGYDADVTLLDHKSNVQHVIVHGQISLWKKEFTENYSGSTPSYR